MQFAIKELTISDLTFFEAQYRKLQEEARALGGQGSKQKGINLNADIFVDVLFPSARGDGERRRFNLPLTIYGPGLRSEPQTLTRKIISAGGGAKNWRLNGELIPNPDREPTRYDSLAAGDIAVIAVEGESSPTAMTLVLLSQSEASDATLYAALSGAVGNRRMAVLSPAQLENLAASSPLAHPIRELADADLDEALEAAAAGSSEGLRRLRRRVSPRRMTAEALRDARQKAEATGFGGEVLLNDWLLSEEGAGRIRSFTWFSDINAVNPWDFEATQPDGRLRRLEAKTTRGPFDRPIQISQAELEFAAEASAPPTDLYRLFEFDGKSAKLAVALDIGNTAREILEVVAVMRPQVVPDGYTVDVHRFGPWTVLGTIKTNDAD